MRKLFVAALLAASAVANAGLVSADTPDEARAKIRVTSARTLEQLYKLHPEAKALMESSAGYAVFDNVSTTILVAGGSTGYGMAVDRRNSNVTYMNMYGVQAGLGLGAQNFRQVFIFKNPSALNEFIHSGWQVGAQTSAAAKNDSAGGAYSGAASISSGVWVYQMTDTGMALEVTVTGVKYAVDDALNPVKAAAASAPATASAPAQAQ